MWWRRARVCACVCVLAARDRVTHSSVCARPTARCVEAVAVAACVMVARARVCACVRVCVCATHRSDCDRLLFVYAFFLHRAREQRAIALRISAIALDRRRCVWRRWWWRRWRWRRARVCACVCVRAWLSVDRAREAARIRAAHCIACALSAARRAAVAAVVAVVAVVAVAVACVVVACVCACVFAYGEPVKQRAIAPRISATALVRSTQGRSWRGPLARPPDAPRSSRRCAARAGTRPCG